jgi:5-(carboxyamino)imidazole ribonucleotide mutase
MPSGIPVATMAIGKAGAINSAIYAAQILGIKYKDIRDKLVKYREGLSSSVIKKSQELRSIGWREYLAKRT